MGLGSLAGLTRQRTRGCVFKFKSMGRSFAKSTQSVIGALDIGTSKVVCAIARLNPSGSMQVLGIGCQAARGIRAGTIIDMEALYTSVAEAIHHAEETADETLDAVYLSVSPAICQSRSLKVELPIGGHSVDEADVKKIMQQAILSLQNPNQVMIHTIPLTYEIDDICGIRDPRGMFGEILKARIHMLFASKTPLRNLSACVERAHLDVASYVVSVYGAGLATLVEDELDLGATLIDMGAGTTSVGVFYGGKLAYADFLPMGGAHVTSDIARCLATPLAQAERIKTLYGTALISPSDSREMIAVPQIGEEKAMRGNQVSKAELTQIIRPRVEEILEAVKEKLGRNSASKLAGRRLVLTGGASLLPGLSEMSSIILDKQTRIGKSLYVKGANEISRSPAFSACAGLLLYGQKHQDPAVSMGRPREVVAAKKSFFRVGSWLRENL